MKIITASEARAIHGRRYKTKIRDFNNLVEKAIRDKKNFIHLPIPTTTLNFLETIKKAGYEVTNNGFWLVTWKHKNEKFF